jgi:cellulose synthase/poly-beta-1,6-N-acetylglucosamine synthase-like glycosyltransferase
VFRADVFAQLIRNDAPYAIDDMFWLAEIVRQRLGRVDYVHKARSWTIDPHTLGDWYRQTVRWSWGQFQSIRGHRLGIPVQRNAAKRLRFSWFDMAYLALLLDWIPYMLEPLILPPLAYFLRGLIDPLWFVAYYVAVSGAWVGVAAVALRKPRLVVLLPAVLALDLVYRLTMMHAFVKAIAQPRIATCQWDSPPRFEAEGS